MLGYSNFIPRRKKMNEIEAKARNNTSKACMCLSIVCMTQDTEALPCPGHGPLYRLTFREVISSKAHHLKPVRALMAPAIGLITGYMKVTGSFGAMKHRRFFLCPDLLLHQLWYLCFLRGHPWQWHLFIYHVFSLKYILHTFKKERKCFKTVLWLSTVDIHVLFSAKRWS